MWATHIAINTDTCTNMGRTPIHEDLEHKDADAVEDYYTERTHRAMQCKPETSIPLLFLYFHAKVSVSKRIEHLPPMHQVDRML